MARTTTKLSDTAVKNAKPTDKEFNLYDGEGLRLRIKPNGSKLWLLNYVKPHSKIRSNLSLGSYPAVSLASARKKAFEARLLISEGIDPKQHRDQQSAMLASQHNQTLERTAKEWFEKKKHSVSEKHAKGIWERLAKNVLPSIGHVPISQLTAPMAIKALRPMESKNILESLKRVTQYLNEIMVYAVNTGLIEDNKLSGIRAAFKAPTKQNMPTITPDELPTLLRSIRESNAKTITRYLIHFQLHTLARPNEAAEARWDEIDEENKLWTIPATRMKMGREHVVPLTPQVMTMLMELKKITGHSDYLFPHDHDPKRHASSQTANAAIKRTELKGKLVAHGMRALASTTLNEQGFDADVIEAAMAHRDPNQVRSAYNRATYLNQRRNMLNWWSQHIEQCQRQVTSNCI